MSKENISILLNISDISIITGDNPYKSKRDYLIDLWQKNFYEDYLIFTTKEKFIKDNDIDIINKISLKNNVNINDQLKKSSETKNINELQNVKNDILSKINNLPQDDKNKITQSINNITHTTFGTNNENDIAICYSNITDQELIKDNKYRKKCIYRNDNICFYIGGRIDGLNKKTGHIIEIKNRVHKLFYTLRDYEKTQLICYLYLFGIEKGQLVEAYKKKDSIDMNIINIEFDEVYMERIMNKILRFITYFIKFINNNELKENILRNNEEIQI